MKTAGIIIATIIPFLEAIKFGGDKNSDTLNELALCLIQLEEFSLAKKYLLDAFALEPESTKIISNLGYLALAEGNKQEARNYFATVLEYDSNDKIAAAELLKLEKDE